MEALINAILVLVFIILLMCMWRMVGKSCMKSAEGFEVIDPRFKSTGNSTGFGISSRTISGEYQKMWDNRTDSLPNFKGSQ